MKNTQWLLTSMNRLTACLMPAILCMALPASWAQTTTTAPTRLRGEIVQVNAQELILKDRSGEKLVVFFVVMILWTAKSYTLKQMNI